MARMRVQIIYLTNADKQLSNIAEDIAANVSAKLLPLINEIDKENAGIFIFFGHGNSKIKIKASPKLEQAISMIL